MKIISSLFFIVTTLCLAAQRFDLQQVFKNHKDGYNVFRIPAVIVTASGKVLAFCEGRKSLHDYGNIDLVMKTSADNGKTWSGLKVIWDNGNNTCGNPAPVFDKVTGDVIVLATLNNDKVFVLRSPDEGISWATPVDITSAVKLPDWGWYATGPVHAIQLEQSTYKRRLVVPCNHTVAANGDNFSHVIYSDDNGKTWQLGGSVSNGNTNESTVAELTNGNLLLNMRNTDKRAPSRKISISSDGGDTWTAPVYDSTLIEPVCQGALLRYSFSPDVLLFTNPRHSSKRKNLTLSVSNDGGKTWTRHITVCAKKSAYSDMVVLSNGDILCLFETGKILPYAGIVSAIIQSSVISK
ncbi:MAG: glycoside hydrolase [Chitinophagales bacterium]|nr:glycoside hydrolase [Chitinophagales bacterium]MDW8417819.1 sialidase family protein [Chitinophagales bacterium]